MSIPRADDRSAPFKLEDAGEGQAWLRVNQAVPWPVALKIASMLTTDGTQPE